jgi:hypothetical protein
VQGDLTARAAETALSMPSDSLAADVIGYDEHARAFAKKIAIGIALCIIGAAVAATMDEWMGDGPTALGFFGFVGIGLTLIIPAALEDTAFKKAHPYVADFYTDEDRIAAKRSFGMRLAAGICCILAAFVFGAFADQVGMMGPIMGLFFVAVAVGVGLIVYAGVVDSRMDVEAYNISALEELSEEEIASIVGEERAPKVLEKVRASKRSGAVCGVIMLLATAVALPLMFWATWYGEPFWRQYFWIPWMVGGLLCGVASIAIKPKE